jgi:hypothetical protein
MRMVWLSTVNRKREDGLGASFEPAPVHDAPLHRDVDNPRFQIHLQRVQEYTHWPEGIFGGERFCVVPASYHYSLLCLPNLHPL